MNTLLDMAILLGLLLVPAVQAGDGKPLLVFEIDEGMPGSLTDVCRDDPEGLQRRLRNIHASLAALTTAYEVAVLVYPTHLYDKSAYARPGAGPLDTIHPRLSEPLEFFDSHREGGHIRVLLELYSSGISTNQDGHLANQPMPPLFARGQDKRNGLSMDLDAAAALASRWPHTLLGVRFHETYGSDLVWRATGQRGFLYDAELVRSVIELCSQQHLLLLWSEPHWLCLEPERDKFAPHYVYNEANKPYLEREPFNTLQALAREKLGKHVCFSWGNNSYHFTTNLEYLDVKVEASVTKPARPIPGWILFDQPYAEFPVKHWSESKWGMSVQSWFWHELTNTLNGQYFPLGELSCPAEVLATYVRKGLREGAEVIQFEPAWYLFNMETPLWPTSAAGHEGRTDYTERGDLKRLKRWLLEPSSPDAPPDRLETFFDRDQRRFHENDMSAPPLNYAQATLGFFWPTGQSVYYDSYVDGRALVRDDQPRFTEAVTGGEILALTRGEFQGDGVDDLAAVKRLPSGGLVLQLFNAKSGLLHQDPVVAADNADGTFFAMACLNLVPRVVGPGDPDEILLPRRSPDGTRLIPRVYHLQGYEPTPVEFRLQPLSEEENARVVAQVLPAELLDPRVVSGLLSQRRDSVFYLDHTRPLDRLVVLLTDPSKLAFAEGGQVWRFDSPARLAPVMLDLDLDRTDELCYLETREKEAVLNVCDLTTTGLSVLSRHSLALPVDTALLPLAKAFGLRCTVQVNARRESGDQE